MERVVSLVSSSGISQRWDRNGKRQIRHRAIFRQTPRIWPTILVQQSGFKRAFRFLDFAQFANSQDDLLQLPDLDVAHAHSIANNPLFFFLLNRHDDRKKNEKNQVKSQRTER